MPGKPQAVTSDSKIVNLENGLQDARDEAARLRGLLAAKDARIETLRQRVLQAASGELCGKCAVKAEADPTVERVVYVIRDRDRSRGGRPHTDPAIVTEALRRVADGERTEAVALS